MPSPEMSETPLEIGAVLLGDGRCQFGLWGPELESVELQIVAPEPRTHALQKTERGLWTAVVDGIAAGTRYRYRLNGGETWADPASRYQPEGVHGPSAVVDRHQFPWEDGDWRNLPWPDYVIYELHIGTFTAAGTFDAAIARLPDLKALGVTAIEIMPVAQFPGQRNWGYDGVYPYAVQNSYGGPAGLKRFVNACHRHGLAAILDVVYNHFGPEGNYTGCYAPFTTDKYQTPWGGAINYDDAWCDGIRQFFIQNVCFWLRDYHFDALRLDAIHAIYDFSAQHLLADMAAAAAALSQELEKPHYLIAESDLNDTRVIRPPAQGGYGIDAQWSDDFHHALHTLVSGEGRGYYEDFGSCEIFARVLQERFAYGGRYSPFRRRHHGNSAADLPATQFVVCSQNHDQVGNRMLGERMSQLTSFEGLKLAAGATLLSPYIPLLFMGEEYGETAPFLYFIDHGDPDLVAAVREGRKAEFKDFHTEGEFPSPEAETTFERSTLDWSLRDSGRHKALWHYYQTLLGLRRQLGLGAPSLPADFGIASDDTQKTVSYRRQLFPAGAIFCGLNFGQEAVEIAAPPADKPWQLCLDSAAATWGGPGTSLPTELAGDRAISLSPLSVVLYQGT